MSTDPAPVKCRRCGDTAGPFVRLPDRPPSRRPLCEDCDDKDSQR